MKIALILLLTLLASAQEKKSRLSIRSENPEIVRLLRDALTGADVALTASRRGDYGVTVAISPLGEDTGCRGVAGVLLIEGRDGKHLSAFIASDPAALAGQMAQRLNEQIKGK